MLAISYVYWLANRDSSRGRVVLTYHAVTAADVDAFECQMQYLSRHANTVFADAVCPDPSRPTAAVTFDDAFQNVFDFALPVLLKLNIPATIFVPTGYIGVEPKWILRGSEPVGPVVSPEALSAVESRLVRFGSHTVTHPRLTEVDESMLHVELSVSKAVLERITGCSIGMLALPYGSSNAGVITAARQAGYRQVFANVPVEEAASPLQGRVNVTPRDWMIEFRLKVQGGYGWMARAVPIKRRLMRMIRGGTR